MARGGRLTAAAAEPEESEESKQETNADTSITAEQKVCGERESGGGVWESGCLGTRCVSVRCARWRWQQNGQSKPTVKCRRQQQQQQKRITTTRKSSSCVGAARTGHPSEPPSTPCCMLSLSGISIRRRQRRWRQAAGGRQEASGRTHLKVNFWQTNKTIDDAISRLG